MNLTLEQKAVLLSEVLKGTAGLAVTLPCPECDDIGPHATNDDRQDPTMLCEACGYQTDLSYFSSQLEAS